MRKLLLALLFCLVCSPVWAYPSYISNGNITLGTDAGAYGTVTPDIPTHQAGDIIIATSWNIHDATWSCNTPGWYEINNAADGDNDAVWYWARATDGSTPSPVINISDASPQLQAITYVFRGCVASGTPHEDNTTNATGSARANPFTSLITTTDTNRLAVGIMDSNDDTGWSASPPPGGWVLADDNATATVPQVRFTVITQNVSAAGDVAAVQFGTISTSEYLATITFALIPEAASPAASSGGMKVIIVE